MPEPATGKRKRNDPKDEASPPSQKKPSSTAAIQIVVGTYERVLHGLTASIALQQENEQPNGLATSKSKSGEGPASQDDDTRATDASEGRTGPDKETKEGQEVNFQDTFLLTAHASSIRCLALSPSSSGRRYLATGSSDETVKIYQINSTAPDYTTTTNTTQNHTSTTTTGKRASLSDGKRINGATTHNLISPAATKPGAKSPNPTTNRELGTLNHHTSTITSLHFPAHSKLLTASLDNTISVVRTRDWTNLNTLRAPQPKSSQNQQPQHTSSGSSLRRPEGDTYATGDSPSGISSLSLHPSHRLAISVGLGERCMRLWNLVAGRKAGVLVFDKSVFGVDEDDEVWTERMGGVVGRSVCWRGDGKMFFVAFEWRVVVFGVGCEIWGVCVPTAKAGTGRRTRVVQVRWVWETIGSEEGGTEDEELKRLLAVSTEDGRILLYSVDPTRSSSSVETQTTSVGTKKETTDSNGDTVTSTTEKSAATGPDAPTEHATKPPPGREKSREQMPPVLPLIAELDTSSPTSKTRIKDFQILPLPHPSDGPSSPTSRTHQKGTRSLLAVSGTSAGTISLHALTTSELLSALHSTPSPPAQVDAGSSGSAPEVRKVGRLLGRLETGRRIVCLDCFVMDEAGPEETEDGVESEGIAVRQEVVEESEEEEDDDEDDEEEEVDREEEMEMEVEGEEWEGVD